MSYTVQIDNAAYRVFKKLPKHVKKKVIAEAQVLADNPKAGKRLKGKYRRFRTWGFNFKGTSYRIIYQVFNKTETIVVRLADTRENIYTQLEDMGVKW